MKKSVTIAIVLLSQLLLVSFHAFPAGSKDKKIYYVLGSSVNMREEPNLNSKIVITLPINSQVVVVLSENGWAKVHDQYQGWIGWINQEFLGLNPQTYNEMWNNYRKTPLNDFRNRIKWLERARALEPTNVDTIDELSRICKESGDRKNQPYFLCIVTNTSLQLQSGPEPNLLKFLKVRKSWMNS
jgi:uncharacterized protein YgiM (DUF1202 family)